MFGLSRLGFVIQYTFSVIVNVLGLVLTHSIIFVLFLKGATKAFFTNFACSSYV
jgi:hypothetical protein